MNGNKSFQIHKCLLYKDNLDGIISSNLKPPIMVNIDPINQCNLRCIWCNGKKSMDGGIISSTQMYRLIDDLSEWGVMSICFAGGGEPTLHTELHSFIAYCDKKGLDTAIITNGYTWNKELIESMRIYPKRIGISVDSASKETFLKTKKVDGFDSVISNISLLTSKYVGKKDITFKFLIHPSNQHEIYDAAKLAKNIGCNMFHLRPIDYIAYNSKSESFDIKSVNTQIERCKELNSDNFKFIKYFVNYGNDLKIKNDFDKCKLSPLLGICLPSGWWLCIDRKGQKGLRLCNIDEIRNYWGSSEHLMLIESINPKKDCGKCTLSKYYDIFEGYKNDEYYWRFI